MSLRLRLPATSANLGPGFDALGLAMTLYLTVEAEATTSFEIEAHGVNADLVGALEGNLMLETYRALSPAGPALQLRIQNEIPLGMGCGSSAAALLAGVMLANHFGGLGMTPEAVLGEACRREGHPDNVAACFLGGMTASAMVDGRVETASVGRNLPWRLLLAIPGQSLATSEARALLPASYRREDAVANVQATALLVSAFALGRPELLRVGTRDRMHQPYRCAACPLLPLLEPLADAGGVYSVALSGAGPAVLLLADPLADLEVLMSMIRGAARDGELRVLEARIAGGAEVW